MLKYLKRHTNANTFIPEIDGLRFFAIITVVIYHLNTTYAEAVNTAWKPILDISNPLYVGWWLLRLDLGVKVFFAISGFVLALPFLKHYLQGEAKISIGEYFYRRLTRLEPPFVITLLGFYAVHVFVLHNDALELLPSLLASLLYIHSFVFGIPSSINPVTWSLETEAQFYIVIPFLLAGIFYVKNKLTRYALVLLMIGLSIWWKTIILQQDIEHLYYSIFSYLSNFMVGVLFAKIFLTYPKFFKTKNIVYDLLGLFSIFIIFYFYKPQSLWTNNLIFNIALFAMILSAFKGIIFNYFYTRQIIYVIGGMCYTIYLLHYAFFHLLMKFSKTITQELNYGTALLIQMGIALTLLMVISSLFFILIEKPCMNKKWPQQLRNFLLKIVARTS